jgi:siroheme synthase-like protein
VTVVAPEVVPQIAKLAGVRMEQRGFAAEVIDLERWALVLACTDSRDVNRRVGELASERGIPVLVADAQDESTFFSPAVFRDGDLQVGVSTGGADPALAKSIRERIVSALGIGWAERIEAARERRRDRLNSEGDS